MPRLMTLALGRLLFPCRMLSFLKYRSSTNYEKKQGDWRCQLQESSRSPEKPTPQRRRRILVPRWTPHGFSFLHALHYTAPSNTTAYDDVVKQFTLSHASCAYSNASQTGLLKHDHGSSLKSVWVDSKGASPDVWDRALGWYVISIVDVWTTPCFTSRRGNLQGNSQRDHHGYCSESGEHTK
ncbi:hypothetical protein BJ875DRAFT_440773 [Amylocarpus encephaloides]|uniref:Uncharacterized protein n=1 Tax=Amylocarpus encephaloides TaxID=45428 RepID=A0A9P7YKR5_9HELO|nr:hypothetical protein BJ875DRAFT_440773 [Amylocarpus encephaloides]